MAKKIQAARAYGPRLKLGRPAPEDEYIDLVTRNSGLSRGEVLQMQEESVDALLFLLKQGRPVHTATTIYTPTIKLDGTLQVNVRFRKQHMDELNKHGEFRGEIVNAENAGKTMDDLCDQWDADHPTDPVER